jgi:hypothetical protein
MSAIVEHVREREAGHIMTELNASIRDIPMPSRISKLPISEAGFPLPWFTAYDRDGKPVPQLADPAKRMRAVRVNLCWICGEPLGRFKAFILGTMCAVNRTTAEPPSHRDCAEYAVLACPFLRNPRMRRNPTTPEEHKQPPAGAMIERNPKVSLIWVTHDYQLVGDRRGGELFRVGAPVEVTFWREGRIAKRAEILESMESGIPILRDMAASEGRQALADLELQYRKALELVPVADF